MPMAGIDNLKKTYPDLLSQMEAEGYSETYIARVRRAARRIVGLWESEGWRDYDDVYASYEASSRSASYLRDRRNIIRVIEQFDVFGRPPDGGRNSGLFLDTAYARLLPVFSAVVDRYQAEARAAGKKEPTVKVASSNASTFLLALQEQGFASLETITERAVLSVFAPGGGSPAKGCSYKKNVAAALKAATAGFPALSQVAAFLPELREERRNIQYLDTGETQKVKDALRRPGRLSLRDRAIRTLALHTGMRGCDIAAMRIRSIDWAGDVIRLDQRKTGAGLELPLSAAVGNAVWDYLASERPQTECPFLFVSNRRPWGRLKAGSMGNIAAKIMDAAGIRTLPGDRRGLHIFRHRLATALLGNNVPRPVVSRTLGHTSPASLDAYLSADIAHLRECALSVERFPVAREVFTNG
jgi:integrase